MEFNILNELLTSSKDNLFNKKVQESTIQNKRRVKQLQKLSKPQNISERGSINDSILSGYSSGSQRPNKPREISQCESVEKQMVVQSMRRFKQAIQKLGFENNILKPRAQLQAHLNRLSLYELINQKKKVKNELKNYDNYFQILFKRMPNRNEKQSFRPLYSYYKKLKQFILKNGGRSRDQIQAKMRNVKNQRRILRYNIQTYKTNFEQTHNRRIRYPKDIKPIQIQYRKYKYLKTELQRLEQILKQTR